MAQDNLFNGIEIHKHQTSATEPHLPWCLNLKFFLCVISAFLCVSAVEDTVYRRDAEERRDYAEEIKTLRNLPT